MKLFEKRISYLEVLEQPVESNCAITIKRTHFTQLCNIRNLPSPKQLLSALYTESGEGGI